MMLKKTKSYFTKMYVCDLSFKRPLFFYTLFLFNAHQLPDGANAVLIGHVANESEPLAIVGGNCAIHGFDHEGEDKYWTVSHMQHISKLLFFSIHMHVLTLYR